MVLLMKLSTLSPGAPLLDSDPGHVSLADSMLCCVVANAWECQDVCMACARKTD